MLGDQHENSSIRKRYLDQGHNFIGASLRNGKSVLESTGGGRTSQEVGVPSPEDFEL